MNHDEPVSGPAPEPQIRWTPFTAEDEARHRQDFLAGTVHVTAAGLMTPDNGTGPGPPCPVLVLHVHEDERTFAVVPQLREAFDLLDTYGAVDLHTRTDIATGWSGMGGQDPLVKLQLRFLGPRPVPGTGQLVVPARRHAALWQHVVDGGLIGISSSRRMERAAAGGHATFADGIGACVLLATGASPVLERFIEGYDWPRGPRPTPP
ncbi:hypothetical protein [Streptomyces sp. NBC_01216]|uniref:hypothetical protein n=1 Tax=unclassified Streptomyces TaxID=2593676 RepID=UPI002E162A05|nr:hypothetical protein OG393_31405 [Streptomyces sp. NBC_01216]